VKRSERLIRNTVLAMAGAVVLLLGLGRLYADDDREDEAPLRDFTAIEVEGEFSLEVVQGADYSVAFTPADRRDTHFDVRVRGKTLRLSGFRNPPGSLVQVALPELKSLNAGRVRTLSVSGFSGAHLSLDVDTVPQVILRNNSVREWQIRADRVADLQIDRASMQAGKVDLAGRVTLTVIE